MQTPGSCTGPTEALGAVILALYTAQAVHALTKERLSLEVEEYSTSTVRIGAFLDQAGGWWY